MAYGKKAKFDDVRELAFGSISNTHSAIGGALTKNARIVLFTNSTNENLYFSTDASVDKVKMPPSSIKAFDITTNKALAEAPVFFEVGTQFYVRHETGSAPSSGDAIVEIVTVETGQ